MCEWNGSQQCWKTTTRAWDGRAASAACNARYPCSGGGTCWSCAPLKRRMDAKQMEKWERVPGSLMLYEPRCCCCNARYMWIVTLAREYSQPFLALHSVRRWLTQALEKAAATTDDADVEEEAQQRLVAALFPHTFILAAAARHPTVWYAAVCRAACYHKVWNVRNVNEQLVEINSCLGEQKGGRTIYTTERANNQLAGPCSQEEWNQYRKGKPKPKQSKRFNERTVKGAEKQMLMVLRWQKWSLYNIEYRAPTLMCKRQVPDRVSRICAQRLTHWLTQLRALALWNANIVAWQARRTLHCWEIFTHAPALLTFAVVVVADATATAGAQRPTHGDAVSNRVSVYMWMWIYRNSIYSCRLPSCWRWRPADCLFIRRR